LVLLLVVYLKRNKYKAKKTEINGILFDSKKEAKRYRELLLLEKSGEITDLVLQKKFNIKGEYGSGCYYLADFFYIKDGEEVIEDVKGYDTPVSKLKRKLLKSFYNIDVTII